MQSHGKNVNLILGLSCPTSKPQSAAIQSLELASSNGIFWAMLAPAMKIVVLDGHTANPGDLSWEKLAAMGDLQVYERTPPEFVVERAKDAEIVFTNKAILDRAAIMALPKLRFIGVLATGYNVVDTSAARERGVPVCNVPNYSTQSVAQAVWALLLELTHHVGAHSTAVRAGAWSSCPDFSFTKTPLVELAGLTLGLVGYGQIGRAVARIGLAMGMKIIACRRNPASAAEPDVQITDLQTVFREGDVVSLHCPLTEQNRGRVDASLLSLMKPSAFFINTARGPLVNENDLASALNSGRIAGAGLDVLCVEPPPPNNPLLTARNCVITPHYAWATKAARRRLLDISADNLRAFLTGHPVNVVN